MGYYDAEPSCWRDTDGKPQGIFVDLFQKVAVARHWNLVWIYDSWDALLDKLAHGKIDVVPAIVHTKSRESFALFSRQTILLDWGAVAVKRGSDISTVLDLHKRKVGYLKDDFWFSGPGSLEDLAQSFGVFPQYVVFQSYPDMFTALGAGKIDGAAASNTLALVNGYRYGIEATPIIYNPVALTFAVSKVIPNAETLLAQMDEEIGSLKTEDPGLLQSLLSKHGVPVQAEIIIPRLLFVLLVLVFLLLLVLSALLIGQTRKLKNVNRTLRASIQETQTALQAKEAYVHETHHRVRNNLQLIVSMLRLQEDTLKEGREQINLRYARDRIFAMSLVEDLIYESGTLDTHSFGVFIEEYIAGITDRLGSDRFKAAYRVDLPQDQFPRGTATPLALILNEAVQNACLHGKDTNGLVTVDISLEPLANGKRLLQVRDRGPAFPQWFDSQKNQGLGYLLIHTLVEQIGGSLETLNDQGAVVRVIF